MKKVSKQNFIRYTSRYLKEFPIVVTHRGVDNLIVTEVTDEDTEEEDECDMSE